MSHIIYDARIIKGGYSGIARYTSSLLVGLLRQSHLYSRLTIILEEQIDYSDNINYQVIKANFHDAVKEVRLKAPLFSWRHHYSIARFVNRQKADLYFYPHFDLPLLTKVSSAFVIHDLYPFYLSDYFGWRNGLMKRYYSTTVGRALKKKNTQFITISQSSLACVSEVFGEQFLSKGQVVYEALPISLVSADQPMVESLTDDKPFLLYVGNRRPNKNLKFMIETFRVLKEDFGYSGRLVMAGGTKNWNYNLDNAIKCYDFIDLLVEVNDNELNQLYQKMDALFYPSLYEGFGLPIIEAASYGKKIITSNRNSMKEIAPDWSLLIDPQSSDLTNVAKEIQAYLKNDVSIHTDQYELGKLSWETIAEQIFKPLLDSGANLSQQ